jgi:O-antigen/teichoic acid export membrane protein
LVQRLDQLIVVAVIGTAGLGIYGVAVNWSEIGQYLGMAIGHSVYEDEGTLDRKAALRIFGRAARWVGAFSIGIGVIGFVLIPFVFGERFAEARWALLLLTPGVAARAVYGAAQQMLLAQGRAFLVSRLNLATTAVAVPVWFAGSAVFGVEGAAAGSSLVYIVQMALSLAPFKDWTWPRHLLPLTSA